MIIGPRQVGKTTLIKHELEGQDILFLDGDDPTVRTLLDTPNTEKIRSLGARNRKIYFHDNGIRNMIIGNFNRMDLRLDKGLLWENFLISERIKQNAYKLTLAKSYFWRTTRQQEVDYVEELNQEIHGYEFRWNPKKKVNFAKTFIQKYRASGTLINRDNFRLFVALGNQLE